MHFLARSFGVTAAFALVALMATARAEAGFVTFTYAGTDVFPGLTGSSVGSGSFGFVDGPSSVSLAQLTSFSLTQTTTVTPISINAALVGSFTYGPGDLTSFSATFNAVGALAGLSFTTDAVASSNPVFTPESFVVTSLAIGGASTYNLVGQQLQVGSITIPSSAVPEPSSVLLMGSGVLAACGYGRRRSSGRASA